VVDSLADDRRLLLFADLRPDLVWEGEKGEADVVALVIYEYPTIRWDMPPELLPPVEAGAFRAHVEAMMESPPPGEPGVAYCVLELDPLGRVVDDDDYNDLEDAQAHLDGAVWEELPADPTQARTLIERRLTEGAGRG
jgi:hypothetical protein